MNDKIERILFHPTTMCGVMGLLISFANSGGDGWYYYVVVFGFVGFIASQSKEWKNRKR